MALPRLDIFYNGFCTATVQQPESGDQMSVETVIETNGHSGTSHAAKEVGESGSNCQKGEGDVNRNETEKTTLPKLEVSLDLHIAAGQETQNEDAKTTECSVNVVHSTCLLNSVLVTQMDSLAHSQRILPTIEFSPSSSKRNPYKARFGGNPNNDFETKIMSSQLLTDEQLRMRWQIAFDILLLLREKKYPDCQLHVFGSLLTGLSNSNSDIDIYMDFRGDKGVSLDQQQPSLKQLDVYSVQGSVQEILAESKCPHTPNLRFAGHVELIGTRVPIVRFWHFQTGVNVDISFGSRVSVQNSLLLLFYMDFDPRVKQLILFLRRWADFHGIAGSQKIKNYALSLMALVYLAGVKIIPPVRTLQTLSACQRCDAQMKNLDMVEGWDCSFCTDRKMIETLFDTESVSLPENYDKDAELLKMVIGFFELMLSTDFSSHVVCPFMGKMVPKDHFLELTLAKKKLPPTLVNWRKKYRDDRTFCQELRIFKSLVIQDPFVLDFNVGGLVDEDTLNAFIDACRTTADILKTKPETISTLFQSFSRDP